MINTEKALEFDRIKEIWLGFALTDFAKREIEGIEPYLSEQELGESAACVHGGNPSVDLPGREGGLPYARAAGGY